MFGNSLAEEYATLVTKQGFTRVEVKELLLTTIATSWMPEENKRQMKAEFCAAPGWSG
jgi:adenosine deaminase